MDNIENKRDYWTYETKCCRCGFITEWFLGSKKIFLHKIFIIINIYTYQNVRKLLLIANPVKKKQYKSMCLLISNF